MAANVLKKMLEVTGEKPQQAGETAQDFLARVKKKIDKLEQDDWKLLGTAAQNWSNDATHELDGGKPLTLVPGVLEKGAAAKEGASKKTEQAPKAAKVKAAKKGAKKAKVAKSDKPAGRPRLADDATLKRLVKKLPDGNRNEYWDKIPDGTSLAKIRKNKSHMRVVRYWKRNKFVALKAA